jgi:hypothetical protein
VNNFQPPPGLNFHCRASIPIAQLARDLQRVTSFLQQYWRDLPLYRFDDWLDQDGRPVYRDTITFDTLADIVSSPRAIYFQMANDTLVGITPVDGGWYLRFYADWDSDGQQLVGRFDVTLPLPLADHFRVAIVPNLNATIGEDEAARYYADPDHP